MSAVKSKAFIGQFYIEIGDGASPEAYTRYCEVHDIKNLGVKNTLVDVTTFCSGGRMEYIAGLADGGELTFAANYSLSNATQELLMDDVDARDNRAFQVTVGDNSPHKVFSGILAMLSYDIAPNVAKQNIITFIGKITGQLLRA
jgi:hypothetical protein